jgi:hypothetical protein
MLLVSGSTKTMATISDPRLGTLLRPGNGNLPTGRPWAADNGAFSGFNEKAFVHMLGRLKGLPGCLWVAAPDVVADATATLALFDLWEPRIRAMGFPVAFIAQDGLNGQDVPWDRFECLFIGGSTAYKLGPSAQARALEAKARGKLVHMGRVNSIERMKIAHQIGVDSVDGTAFSRFGKRWIQWGLDALREQVEPQQSLFFRHGGSQ